MRAPQHVKDIIDANGGRMVGRTRLQKSVYLLEAAGVNCGFDFSYHYYGPYSDDLAVAAFDAEALGLIQVSWETSQAGLPYAVYQSHLARRDDEGSGRCRGILEILGQYEAISLELAATAHFLATSGYERDPWREVRKRKPAKASADRVSMAQKLLNQLGMPNGTV